MLLNVFSTTYTWHEFMNGLTSNMKSCGKYERWEEGERTLHRWPKSWEICGCTRPFQEALRHLVESGVQHWKWGGDIYPGKRKLLLKN